jgi:hypothetical protein
LARLEADLEQGFAQKGFGSPAFIADDSILEARLHPPPWFRKGGKKDQEVLAAYATALGVAHMVQGHQPGRVTFDDDVKRKAGAMFQYDGLLFLVDSGMSRGVDNSTGALLRIETGKHDKTVAICSNGAGTTLWDDDGKPATRQAEPCGEE